MALTLVIPVRHFYHLEDIITPRHLANMAKLMIATSLVVAHGYVTDTFIAWYSGDEFDKYITVDKFTGQYAPLGWMLMIMDVGLVQAFWFRAVRESPAALFIIALVANTGLWLDHFILVVQSLHNDFMPSEWKFFRGTIWDWMTLFGSFGLFLTLFFVFIRIFPMVSMFEVRKLSHKLRDKPEARG
jgi:molybdopterin-containing oxidoreductase family membrane subunit